MKIILYFFNFAVICLKLLVIIVNKFGSKDSSAKYSVTNIELTHKWFEWKKKKIRKNINGTVKKKFWRWINLFWIVNWSKNLNI